MLRCMLCAANIVYNIQAHISSYSTSNPLCLQEVKSELPLPSSDVVVLPVDLCGPFADLRQTSQAAMQAFGGIDYVVHCVGVCAIRCAEVKTVLSEVLSKGSM
jgi:NAD(P)-dependent dehydrogenase (short-subunit alcohol dehydrogenase family)